MRIRRFFSAALALALAASLTLPTGAASSFTDVSDQTTAVNADILRLMGVVSGVGNDKFNPGANLTRAEFCTMVVKFMQKGDQVPLHATRTIFSDVTAKHWGLGYVNLAASLQVEDDGQQLPLVSGVGNGKFEPDSNITLAQACTILIRVLGYTSKQAGAVWPESYMNLADSIGLTDGVSAGMNAFITRAQAAQLLVNALTCKTSGGSDYYKSLGTVKDDTILLAVNVTTDDGSSDGAIRTTDNEQGEAYLAAAGKVSPSALLGKRGALVLNDKSEIVTFVPDDSNAITITLSGAAQPSYVKSSDGKQYTMSKDTLLYTSDSKDGRSYTEGYTTLVSGNQITMYSEKGKIVAVYASGSTSSIDSDAVVVTGSANTALFHQLTGGVTNFKIQKNRQTISMSDIKPYDVVSYDSVNNVLLVSDLRLTCLYEDASPNTSAPTELTVLGHTFPVLESAWDTAGDFSLGNTVTLLLTVDGKVAGIVSPTASRGSNAVGMVTGAGAEIFRPDGGTIKLTGTVSSGDRLSNQLVVISSSSKGRITASTMPSSGASGDFDLSAMKLGSYTVTAGVRIFERVGNDAVAPIQLSTLDTDTISAAKIHAFHRNSSGMVDYIVLNAVTGDTYTYGLLEKGQQLAGSEEGENIYDHTITLTNGTGGLGKTVSNYAFTDNSFGGVCVGADGKVASIISLSEKIKVTPSDFFTSQGVSYVNAKGKVYRVSDDVECYKSASKSWFSGSTGQDRLAACKAFSSDLAIYIDPIGEKVRIVSAN